MAERRMFAKSIIDSDAFLDMPLSAQALYFHLSMRADDEGVLGNAKRVRTMIGASEDDFKLLIVKRFVIVFEDGITVIRHWRVHNIIQKDRFKETIYVDERARLGFDKNKAYTECLETPCIQSGNETETQVRLGKGSLGKERLGEESASPSAAASNSRFVKPTLEEIAEYCRSERKNNIDPQVFFDFYESVGWKVGNKPMKDWRACVRTWERREKPTAQQPSKPNGDKYKRED